MLLYNQTNTPLKELLLKMNENNIWCVYKHTNLINGKIYIGKTCKKPEYRWNEGKGYFTQKHFWYSIQKYGWNNFLHEIVENGLSAKKASELEIKLIAHYDSMNPDKGYNQTAGGEGMLGWHHTTESRNKIIESNKRRIISDATRKKQSESHKGLMAGENNPFFGKQHSEETKKKISQANTGKTHLVSEETKRKISQANTGKSHPISEETREKISNANKGRIVSAETRKKLSMKLSGEKNPMYGRKSPTAKIINQYSLDGILVAKYDSATSACNATGISNISIGSCCKGLLNSAGGYIWRYEKDKFDTYTLPQNLIEQQYPILRYDLNGNCQQRYSSIFELIEKTRLNKYSVLEMCRKKNGSYSNSIWRFEGDEEPITYRKNKQNGKKVLQYSKDGEYICSYETIGSAAKALNCTSSCISDCCKGKSKSAKGYLLFYLDNFSPEVLEQAILNIKRNSKKVLQFDMDENLIAEYRCVKDAADVIGVSQTMIYYCCENKVKHVRNFIFKFK